MKIVQVFREEKRGQGVIGEEAVGGPIADEGGEGVEVVVEAALQAGDEEIGALDDAGDLRSGLIEAREIGAVAKVAREGFDGGARGFPIFLAVLEMGPLRKNFGAFFDANAVAQVVAEDDLEAREEDAEEKIGKRAEA